MIGATIYFGSAESSRQIVEAAEACEKAHDLGMATILRCYLGNEHFKADQDYQVATDLTGQVVTASTSLKAVAFSRCSNTKPNLPADTRSNKLIRRYVARLGFMPSRSAQLLANGPENQCGSLMSDESITLVERWREGDEDAATELYEQYFAKLMHIVSGHLTQSYKKQVDPEDVLQSAFGTVFRRISNGEFTFESDGDVWKLLVTVVLNKLRHRVRYLNAGRRDIRRELRAESDFDGVLAAQLSQPPGISEAAEFAELVRDIFEFLPEQERMLLQLRMDGYGQREIAERLDVADRTVRRMWDRIRVRLNSLLQEHDQQL